MYNNSVDDTITETLNDVHKVWSECILVVTNHKIMGVLHTHAVRNWDVNT